MGKRLATMRVVHGKGTRVINVSDFDPKTMKEATEPKAKAEKAEKKAEGSKE